MIMKIDDTLNKRCSSKLGPLIVLFFIFLLPFLTAAQVRPDLSLVGQRFNVLIKNKNFQDSLVQLSRVYNVPIGFQVSDEAESPPCKEPIDLDLRDADISQIMDRLILACPTYSWSLAEGAVNVFPSVKEQSVLDVWVANINIKRKGSEKILDAIFDQEEVKRELKSSGSICDTTAAFWEGNSKADQTYSITFSEKQVRDILNYLIVNTEKRSWIYYRLSNDKTRFSLRFF